MLEPADAARAKASARQGQASESVHPLVLLANLKMASARVPGSELGLEQLTEWLAGEVGHPYRRIDPTRLDVAGVTDLVSHAYARRHRILPLEVMPDRAVVATSEPLALDWLGDVQRMLRREIDLVVASPLDLHRYTMEFYGVTRSIRGAKDTREGDGG
ncbi:MAG: type II/IV secretion system protein, partial [Gammaproteobacteria bacterium]|nr:type II/IV secretion system protein [Gammaproteobacteria bacterium]